MNRHVALMVGLGVMMPSAAALGQSCPSLGSTIHPGESGQVLLNLLVADYTPASWLGYDEARDMMYTEIDNDGGFVTGRYTGYSAFIDPASLTPRADATAANINAEHSWPQSKGADVSPARSNMHHLFPSYGPANSARGNSPFDEIPDPDTDSWHRLTTSVSTPDPLFIDEYSEQDNSNPHPSYSSRWEPREDHKGDVARAMFYFYTLYKAQADVADPNFFDAQKDVLRAWHLADPVDAREYDRTCAIAPYQDDMVNPFVIDPSLVERAYFGVAGTTVVRFARADDQTLEGSGEYLLRVEILSPDPTSATTVQVALIGGSADNGVDIQSYSTQELVFPAASGVSQSVSIFPVDDLDPEGEEDLIFVLQNPQGGNSAELGDPSEFTLTLLESAVFLPGQLWVNELHYDNSGTDVGEFVELAVRSDFPDLAGVTLSLYNGSNGEVYDSFTGAQFQAGSTQGAYRLYTVSPSSIQNGSPDGLALDYQGAVIQFLSYEGSITAVGGPAAGLQSTDIGTEESSSAPVGSSISLVGDGRRFEDFVWSSGVDDTPGDPNVGQTLLPDVAVLVSGLRATHFAGGVELYWRVSGASTGLRFDVYRRSAGQPWERRNAASIEGEEENRFLDEAVLAGGTYSYEIQSSDDAGTQLRFGPVELSIPTSGGLRLLAGPSPARGAVLLSFQRGANAAARLRIYDAAGRLVREFGEIGPLAGTLRWDGRDQGGRPLASGVYFAQLRSGRRGASSRIVLLR